MIGCSALSTLRFRGTAGCESGTRVCEHGARLAFSVGDEFPDWQNEPRQIGIRVSGAGYRTGRNAAEAEPHSRGLRMGWPDALASGREDRGRTKPAKGLAPGTAAETVRRFFVAAGVAGALFLLGAVPLMAQNILSVTAGPDSLSPNPVDAGVQSTVHLTANVTNPSQPQQEETINGPVWGWTVTDVQFQAPGSSTWMNARSWMWPSR